MNENIIKFTDLCARSRHIGLSLEEHHIKIDLVNQLVDEGLMSNDGMYKFVNKEDSDYFHDTIKNYDIQ